MQAKGRAGQGGVVQVQLRMLWRMQRPWHHRTHLSCSIFCKLPPRELLRRSAVDGGVVVVGEDAGRDGAAAGDLWRGSI